MNYYAIYRAKDNKLLAAGTSQECKKQLKLKHIDAFYLLMSNCKHGTNTQYIVHTTKKSKNGRPSKWYTVYRAKDDVLLAAGTSFECAKRLKFKNVNSFYGMVCRCTNGTNKKYVVVVDDEDIGEEDDC